METGSGVEKGKGSADIDIGTGNLGGSTLKSRNALVGIVTVVVFWLCIYHGEVSWRFCLLLWQTLRFSDSWINCHKSLSSGCFRYLSGTAQLTRLFFVLSSERIAYFCEITKKYF